MYTAALSKMIILDPDLDPDPAPKATSTKRATVSASPAKSRDIRLPSARTLARFTGMAQKAVRLKGQVTVLLTTDAAIRRLNRQFRGKDKATDVLSFPAEGVGAEQIAGDLAISVTTALGQAAEQGHSLSTEIKVLILHGLLHLAGYDHEADTGQMARRERLLRAKLGLPQGLIERAAERTEKPVAEIKRRLKGTGFSPYIAPAKSKRALAPEGRSSGTSRKSGKPKASPRAPSNQSARP